MDGLPCVLLGPQQALVSFLQVGKGLVLIAALNQPQLGNECQVLA
jgi:hypothetical protein